MPVNPTLPKQSPVPYLVIGSVWLLAMVWMFFALTSPANSLNDLPDMPGIASGSRGSFYLDAGEHGVWITHPKDFNIEGYSPNGGEKAVEILDNFGEEVRTALNSTESLVISKGETTTSLYRSFQVPNAAMYTIISNLPAGDNFKVNFGPVWTPGDLINPTSGGIVLAIGWLVTMGCAIAAFRVNSSRRKEIQKYLSENNEPTNTKRMN